MIARYCRRLARAPRRGVAGARAFSGWRARTTLLGLLAAALVYPPTEAREAEVDPVGIWNCLLYGPDADLRFYLQLGADGSTRMARSTEAAERGWLDLSRWRRTRGGLTFQDVWNRRTFTAKLTEQELGGTWQGQPGAGGWWCGAVEEPPRGAPPEASRLMHVPAPAIMASPRYPLAAIREAKEGRAVSCFIVTGAGDILRPHVVESTEDIFLEPMLDALARSRYRSFGDDSATTPACRSFTFELSRDR